MRLCKIIIVIVLSFVAFLLLTGDVLTVLKQSLSHWRSSRNSQVVRNESGEPTSKYKTDQFRILWEGLIQDCKPAFVMNYIEKEYDVNYKDRGGMTLLMFAAGTNHESTKLLIENGANINDSALSGYTALMSATQNGSRETIKLLLNKGANINAKRTDGETVLFNVLRRDRVRDTIPIIDLLLNNGANIEARGYRGITPLMQAAQDGNIEIAEHLIKKGASITAQDDNGYSVISYAFRYPEALNLLITHGANVNEIDIKTGRSLLMGAAQSGNIQAVKLLIEHGADVNAKDKKGRSVLIHSARSGNIQVVKLLIEHGAVVNAATTLGEDDYTIAAEIQNLLVEKGARLIKKYEGIDIVSPLEGQRYKTGDKGKIVVKAKPGIELKGVSLGFVPLSYSLWKKAYVGEFQVPINIQPSEIEIQVYAVTKDGKATEATRHIIAEFPTGVILIGIEVPIDGSYKRDSIHLTKLLRGTSQARAEVYETEQLRVFGIYSDGINRDEITAPSFGTTYSTSNEHIAVVSPDGIVKAVDIGTAFITVRNGQLEKKVKVIIDPDKHDVNGQIRQQIGRLSDNDPEIRSNAAARLGSYKSDESLKALLDVLYDDDSKVMWAAAGALGKLKDPISVPPLIQALSSGKKEVKRATAEALGNIGDKRAVNPLITALKDKDVAPYAAGALRKIGDTRAIEPLIEFLGKRGWWGRDEAVSALLSFRDPRLINLLISVLDDEDVANYATQTLIGMKDAQVINSLISAVKNSKSNSRISYKAGKTLSLIGEEAVEPLIQCLKDTDWTSREIAAYFLGEMKDWRAVSPLIDLLKEDPGIPNTRNTIRDIVSKSLKKITGQNFGPNYEKWKTWHDTAITKK